LWSNIVPKVLAKYEKKRAEFLKAQAEEEGAKALAAKALEIARNAGLISG
jgi:hypothetical protein